MRHFLRDDDISPAEQQEILQLASELKRDPYGRKPLAGPATVALLFDKTSTRTRVSFAAGVAALGGYPLIINPGESQLGEKESISDSAKMISRIAKLIVWRTGAHSRVEEMAEHSQVPVINSLTDDFHPCQILADLLTIQEHKGKLQGLTVAYVGDAANNMGQSYALGFATAGIHVRLAGPAGYLPSAEVVADAERIAAATGGSVTVTTDPHAAAAGADVVITDTWVSMGQESEKLQRVATFGDYRVTPELFAQAAPDAIFMHCLPAYREFEVDSEVIDGPRSVVWDEAENRLHAQNALMCWLLEQKEKAND